MFSSEEVREQTFFLVEYSKGLDYSSVAEMNTRERVWHVKRLIKKLEQEKKAHEEARQEAEQKAKAAGRSRRRR